MKKVRDPMSKRRRDIRAIKQLAAKWRTGWLAGDAASAAKVRLFSSQSDWTRNWESSTLALHRYDNKTRITVIAHLAVMPEKRGITENFNAKKDVLESLGMTNPEFVQAVFDAFAHGEKRDCRTSIHVLPVTLKGRRYLLEEVADIRIYGETPAGRAGREQADQAARNTERESQPNGGS
jgi:hypothetical protein